MKDAIFWDVARRRFFEVSKETVAEILHTEEGSKHKPFPEIFLSFYQTTRRHIPKIMLLFFYSWCFLILSGWLLNTTPFYRFHSSTFDDIPNAVNEVAAQV